MLSVPLLVWVGQLLVAGWFPHGDMAFHAVHTHDVFGSNSPLLGMPTTSGNAVEGVHAHHPGPLYFQLMAPFYAMSGFAPWGLLLGGIGVLIACVAVMVAAANAADGWRGMRAFTAAWLVILAGWQTLLAEPWNPWPSIAAGLAAMASGWAVCRGLWWWLPPFAFMTSLAAQSHLAAAPVMLGLGIAVVIHSVLVVRSTDARLPVAPFVWTGAVLAVVWAAPLYQQVTGDPGNLTAMTRYADEVDGGLSLWVGTVVVGVAAVVVFRSWSDVSRFWTSTRPGTLMGLGVIVGVLLLWSFFRTTGIHGAYLVYVVPVLMPVVFWRVTVRKPWQPGLRVTVVLVLAVAWSPWPALHQGWEQAKVVDEVMNHLEPELSGSALPIEVRGSGTLANGDSAPGVYAELVARGHEVSYVSPFANAEVPRQDDFRHPRHLTGQRLVVSVETSDDAPVEGGPFDHHGETVVEGRTIWWGLALRVADEGETQETTPK